MISVRNVYTKVCNTLLEPGGLTGLTLTDDDFLYIVNNAIRNFLNMSNCFIYINNIQSLLGVRIYDHPYWVNQPYVAMIDEANLYRSSGSYWDNSNYRWQQQGPGNPIEWRNDQLEENQIEIRPAPYWDGYEVTCVSGLFGMINTVSFLYQAAFYSGGFYSGAFQTQTVPFNPNATVSLSCDPSYPNGFLGTISKADLGTVYVQVVGGMYGTIANMIPSDMNITEFTSYNLDAPITSIDDYVPDIPESFEPYIAFMTLQYIFAQDGEVRNDRLEKYYAQRFKESVRLLDSVSSENLMEK